MSKIAPFVLSVAAFVLSVSVGSAENNPPGSYQASCRDIDADGNTLSADCRNRRGEWVFTTLDEYGACGSDIANVDGRLACVEPETESFSANLPPGSYRRSCRESDADGITLRAECRDVNGRWRYTELEDYRDCRGDISNQNGMLICGARAPEEDEVDEGESLPPGSWARNCKNARVYGRVLYASCRNKWGRFQDTSLDLRNCRQDISVVDGRLICGRIGGIPFGRIILYKHSNYGGKSRTYGTDASDLNSDAFGNQASSVVIQGGTWQLCDRPNFKGFCVIVDRTQRNLSSLGFNDKAESVRRIK